MVDNVTCVEFTISVNEHVQLTQVHDLFLAQYSATIVACDVMPLIYTMPCMEDLDQPACPFLM